MNPEASPPIVTPAAPILEQPTASVPGWLVQAANTILVLAALGSASVAILIALRTRPNGIVEALVWSAVPTVVSGLLIASLRLAGAKRASVALLLVVIIAFVCATELLLAALPVRNVVVVDERDVHRAAANRAGRRFDQRSSADVIRDLRSQGDSVYPVAYGPTRLSLSAARARLDTTEQLRALIPLSPGVSSTRTVFCNELGEWILYPSDERGFNNPSGLWSHDAELALLGDSFTHGTCVPTESGLAGRLRETQPLTLSLGLAGTGPLLQLAVMREYLPSLRPRTVVWFYYEANDIIDLREEFNRPGLVSYLTEGYSQNLMQRQQEIDGRLRRVLDLALEMAWANEAAPSPVAPKRLDVRALLKLTSLRERLGVADPFPMSDAELSRYGNVVSRARSDLCKLGTELRVVYLPAYGRFSSGRDAGDRLFARRRVIDLLERMDVPTLDVSSNFATQPDPQSLWVDSRSHYTARGFELVAQAVSEWLGTTTPASERRKPSGC